MKNNAYLANENCSYRFAFTIAIVVIMTTLMLSSPVFARVSKQKVFNSPDEAVNAMVTAIKTHNIRGLTEIFGAGSKGLFFVR